MYIICKQILNYVARLLVCLFGLTWQGRAMNMTTTSSRPAALHDFANPADIVRKLQSKPMNLLLEKGSESHLFCFSLPRLGSSLM